ncbi:MAG: hypothetical protein R3E79_47385 [Caldilineaceae bacterium]
MFPYVALAAGGMGSLAWAEGGCWQPLATRQIRDRTDRCRQPTDGGRYCMMAPAERMVRTETCR